MKNDFLKGFKLVSEEEKLIDYLKSYEFQLGVFVEGSTRKEENKIGVTNAELLYIHENGSPSKNIPKRSILEITFKQVKDTLVEKCIERCIEGILIKGWKEGDINKELEQTAIEIENRCKEIILDNDGTLVANAESTAIAKAMKLPKYKKYRDIRWYEYGKKIPENIRAEMRVEGNHPLFDTGELAGSIRCKPVKIR